jgi:alkylation response protein AidB-like acyl-CoA dehydrogenase
LRELRTVLTNASGSRHIADREMVQGRFGQLVVSLQAVEALAYAFYERVDALAIGEKLAWSRDDRYRPRALAVHATQVALECVQMAFHRSGSGGLVRPNIFEKLLRDMSVAATHSVVDDTAFASYAQQLVETGGPIELADRVGSFGPGGQ